MRALKVSHNQQGADVQLTFTGMLDENAVLPEFPSGIDGRLIINLGSLTMINSLGCRVWAKWIKSVNAKHGVILRSCSPAFITQVNVLQNFIPPGVTIESLQVPYLCGKCNNTEKLELPLASAEQAPDHDKCPRCGGEMEANIVRAKYFNFLKKKAA